MRSEISAAPLPIDLPLKISDRTIATLLILLVGIGGDRICIDVWPGDHSVLEECAGYSVTIKMALVWYVGFNSFYQHI